MYLRYFHYLPSEKGVVLHLNQLECPLPKDALFQVWLIWPSGSAGEDFVNVFSLLRNCLPLEKGMALNLIEVRFPIPKDALCHVCLKFAQ